jgi:hypothetical protein
MATQVVPITASRQTRLIGPALTLGGLLWITDFVLILVNGLLTGMLPGADAQTPLYLRIGLRLFVLSIIVLNLGLSGLFGRLRRRSSKLSLAGAVFMTIGVALASVNTVMLSGLAGPATFNDIFMGFSIFATAIATGLLSVAALRTRGLPRGLALTLLFVGITTIPILFGTPLPFGPDWATDHLAFLTSGIAYVIVGLRN